MAKKPSTGRKSAAQIAAPYIEAQALGLVDQETVRRIHDAARDDELVEIDEIEARRARRKGQIN